MSITSLSFILFMTAVVIVYFAVPKHTQWVILLVASMCFYAAASLKGVIYVLITATSIYIATRCMQNISDDQKTYLKEHKGLSKEEKKNYKAINKKKRRWIMVCTLLLNLGILCVFKYYHFALSQINIVISIFNGTPITDRVNLIIPLGISFYTFQSVGYLVDVFWEKYRAEKNYLKVLLFVSFFPQITQGPISEFDQLGQELFSEHSISYHNFLWGLQRILWGLMKKMLIADALSPSVLNIFQNYQSYSGITTLIGAFMYSVQIYADFSGYMDIMCGFCEILGIKLMENFERPYFSKSVTEYWRRWHISLGLWFKKYVYYPIGMSKWSRTLAKKTRTIIGKQYSDTVPATIALVITWLATGLWHGASWAYASWGLLNGLFIILSLWLEPIYESIRGALKLKEKNIWWRGFQVIRTFILVTFIKVLPEVGTLRDGLGLWKHIFTNFDIPSGLSTLLPFLDWSTFNLPAVNYFIAVLCTFVLLVSSLLQRKKALRARFNELPIIVRLLAMAFMIIAIASFGVMATWGTEGFLYENF